ALTLAVNSDSSSAIAILQNALGARVGNAMAAFASVAMWFCGLSCLTSTSRAVYSLARDNGLPRSGWLRRVNPRHGTPGPAIWMTVVACMLAMLWTGAIPIVTSLSTVALYTAYVIPVALGLRSRLAGSEWPSAAVWTLGRYGVVLNSIAVVYTALIVVILVMPPNQLAGKTMLGLIVILAVMYFWVRGRYVGPPWRGK